MQVPWVPSRPWLTHLWSSACWELSVGLEKRQVWLPNHSGSKGNLPALLPHPRVPMLCQAGASFSAAAVKSGKLAFITRLTVEEHFPTEGWLLVAGPDSVTPITVTYVGQRHGVSDQWRQSSPEASPRVCHLALFSSPLWTGLKLPSRLWKLVVNKTILHYKAICYTQFRKEERTRSYVSSSSLAARLCSKQRRLWPWCDLKFPKTLNRYL